MRRRGTPGMNAGLDVRQVRRAFARAAGREGAHEALPAEMALRLHEHLEGREDFQPTRILDVGCGAGAAGRALAARFPDAELLLLDAVPAMLRVAGAASPTAAALCGDAEALPLADASVDLVHAHLVLPWCNDPGRVFDEFRRVVRPHGLVLFSTLGPDTLKELLAAFDSADALPHVARFMDMHDIGDALLELGFRDPVMQREDFTLTYREVDTLLGDLRAAGATNADVERRRSLTGRGRLAAMRAAYEEMRSDGVLPATFEAIYACAQAPGWRLRRHAEAARDATRPEA